MSSKSVTAEMLRRRRDIPDAEVEALVERAALLQERAHDRQENHATEAEIAEVAAELDIAPEYVEQAITAWRTEKTSGPINPPNPRILARRKTAVRVVMGIAAAAVAGLAVLLWLIF